MLDLAKDTIAALVPTALGVGLLVGLTVLILRFNHTRNPFSPAWAVFRGALQLAIISVLLTGVITHPVWVTVALAVMFTMALVTAAKRLGGKARHYRVVGIGMGAGVLTTLVIIFSTGTLELSSRYALAMGGIIIGNAMTIATLAGRRLTEATIERWDEVEAWLSLGATPRQSTVDMARQAIYSALIPATDQTKTTGLVTLPGAFIGAIFGGVSPLEAGRFQIVVLAGIMCAGAITAALLAHFLAPVQQKPLQLDS